MMGSLFVRIWLFVGGAFGLGLAVGWLFWRYHRSSVPAEEWQSHNQELVALHEQVGQVVAAREALAVQLERLRLESSRLQGLLTDAWHEREALRARLVELDQEAHALRAQLEQSSAHGRYLQRRVTELSIVAARTLEVDPVRAPLSERRRVAPPQPPQPPPGPDRPPPLAARRDGPSPRTLGDHPADGPQERGRSSRDGRVAAPAPPVGGAVGRGTQG